MSDADPSPGRTKRDKARADEALLAHHHGMAGQQGPGFVGRLVDYTVRLVVVVGTLALFVILLAAGTGNLGLLKRMVGLE